VFSFDVTPKETALMNKFTLSLLAASALCAVGTVAVSMPASARDRDNVSVSVTFGGAAFGYEDGYYDNDRRWHQWRDDDERAWYQENHGPTYHRMSRADDRDDYRREWREGRRADWRDDRRDDRRIDFAVSLDDIEFAYEDGYYDNGRRWHGWRSEDERRWYQQNRGPTYFRMGRYDDRDNYRRDWRNGRRTDWRSGGDVDFGIVLGNVVFAYSDGYYDNGRRWHRWRSDDERRWYQQNRRQSYYHMSRYRDRDRNRRGWRDGRRNDWRPSSYDR
jgi:hypothetical protein